MAIGAISRYIRGRVKESVSIIFAVVVDEDDILTILNLKYSLVQYIEIYIIRRNNYLEQFSLDLP